MFSLRLSDSVEKRLNNLSERTNRSKSYYVKKALTKFLEEEEERLLILEAYDDYLRSGKKTIPFEEVMKKAGLDNE